MTKYEKLVRDNIPEILIQKGVPFEKRIADEEEYQAELIKKLTEEVTEFSESKGSPEELADVLEVVSSLLKLPVYQNVSQIAEQKRQERGGFDKRFIVAGEK